jgi:Protein of unknown function (DUF3237)
MELRSQLLFDMQAEVRERYPIENTPRGTRVNVSVAGGTFAGPKLKGTILPGGGDFALVRPDGVVEIDVRITLRTDDGQHIYMTYRGLNAQGAEYAQKIQRGEAVSATEFYFRTTPYFETSAAQYAWLNKIVAVGVWTHSDPGRSIAYRVYEIL